MRKFKDPVLIIGGGLAGLWIARILGKHGIPIYLLLDGNDEAMFSKYCKESFVATGIRQNRETLKNFLRRMARSLTGRVVVYPTSDLDALNLSELKEEIVDDYHFVVGDKESVRILVNKKEFYKALERSGIEYPATCFPQSLEDARDIRTDLTYPVFIRPAITQLFNQAFRTNRKGLFAHSPRELVDHYKLARNHGLEVMFQEIIPGPPTNSYQLEGYYDMNYRATVLFARQRQRIWPLNFGNTTLCVSIPLARLAKEKETVDEFVRTIRYRGLMSAEFKKDSRDGTMKFLEVNARAWWHFWLASMCGVDIIFSSYLDAIGEKHEYAEEYRTGIRSMYLLNDLKASMNMILKGSLGPSEWVSSLQGNTRFAFFQTEDLSPFVMNSAKQLLMIFKRFTD